MEKRLLKVKESGSNSKKKDYTKEELLERKRELLKNARNNVKHSL